jgi:tripartite-type tricarboxylate transporter receptor subunit TctC
MLRVNRRRFLAGCLAMSLPFGPAVAADYPDHPIHVIIPYTAGGVAESIVRMLAVGMERKLGQRLIIEAKPGAAGNIGTIEVARAKPDGYTILVAATNNYIINQYMMKMPVDPLQALTPVAKLADVPLVLFSNPQVPAKSFKEFVALARANPGKYNYGTPSVGTVNHLLMERFKQTNDINIVNVPFHGSPQATMALLQNQIQLFPIGLAAGLNHLRAGKLTALAVATKKRLPALPDVPTLAEAGYPGFTATNWWGMAVPAGTPEPIVQALADAVAEGKKNPVLIERYKQLGFDMPEETRAEFAASLAPDAALWRQTIERGKLAVK